MISAETISRAISDLPVQPLFNTIYMQSRKANIPVIVTNTNNNLRVTAKANVGSAAEGVAITDAMFNASKSTVEVDGFTLTERTYFTLLDLDSNISQIPNEMRTDAAGLDEASYMEILSAIGNKISEQIMADFFASLQVKLVGLVPSANVTQDMAGRVEWDTTIQPPASGKLSITSILDDIQVRLPLTMKPGGTAGDIVTVWVSAQDFSIMENSTVAAFQYNKNGGITPNNFVYIKAESTLDETQNMFRYSFMRRNNIVIRPWNGLWPDSLICTYQEGLGEGDVFFEKVPSKLRCNLFVVLKGALLRRDDELTVPIKDVAQNAFNLPYVVGNQLTINKSTNAISEFKVLGKFASGVLLRESNKLFAYLPDISA